MTTAKPPPGFTTLDRAANTLSRPFDVIGVCVDHLEPTKTKGTDYVSTFTLWDPSWYRGHGLKFRFFNSAEDNLPRIKSNGDIVILRNVMIKLFNGETLGLSNSATCWVVVSGSTVIDSTASDGSDVEFTTSSSRGYQRAPAPTVEELTYAKKVLSLIDPTTYRPPPRATALQIENIMKGAGGTPPPRQGKWQLIKDLTPDPKPGNHNFADLFGEVRKSWYNDYGRVQLSLTDYTTNKWLYKYAEESSSSMDGDEFNYSGSSHSHWPGPWGRMTIEILLYDAHADFVRSQVKPGMYVVVRNCQIKRDPNGSKLEAVCRGDKMDPGKVNVIIQKPSQAENDSRFQGLLQRKLEYEKHARAKGLRLGFGSELSSKKRTADKNDDAETNDNDANEEAGTTKKPSKAARKRRKQQAAAAAAAKNDDRKDEKGPQVNQYVRCLNVQIPLTSVSDILDPTSLQRTTPAGNPFCLPFQNCSYKCKVRVVDYWPRDLRDFAVQRPVPGLDSDTDTSPSDNDNDDSISNLESSQRHKEWEWRFCLVVQDSSSPSTILPQMPLLVAGPEAEYLLRAEASDLRADPLALARLREKMFLLWGNLQEVREDDDRKEKEKEKEKEKVVARPFECFVHEYGVRIGRSAAGVIDGGGGGGGDGKAEVEQVEVEEEKWQRVFRIFGTST